MEYLDPGTLPGNPPRNAIGLVLSSNWAGFVAKTDTRKVKLNWLSLTGLACFLYKNTNMFTFSGLRSDLLL